METYRVMIKAVGKTEGNCFDSNELLRFPRTDLRTIDKLWVKHSNERFGFSVQKKIYLSVGGRIGGGWSDNEKAWEQYCARVGWRKWGGFLLFEYDNVTFDDTASKRGHLPAYVVFRDSGIWGRWMSDRMMNEVERADRWLGLASRLLKSNI
mgnify:CR=1 FL=1